MGFTIEYGGDETTILLDVLTQVAGYQGVAAITHNVRPGVGTVTSTEDYVVEAVGVPGSGAVRLLPWSDELGGPDPEADPLLLHVEDISEVVIY